ncbi:MAG TPA: DinB family protein, partial [bacterium]
NSFPSIRETLVHMLSAEWIWLTRWNGSSPTGMPESWELSTHASLRRQWLEAEREQTTFVSGLTEDALNKVISYRNTAGQPFANPLWQMMRHVVNHSTYHRGQVTTMLRQLGAEAVATDLIVFFREKSGQS